MNTDGQAPPGARVIAIQSRLMKLIDPVLSSLTARPATGQPGRVERRRHPRVPAYALQSCLLIGDRYCDGQMEDISLGGAKFRGAGQAPGAGGQVRIVSPAPLPREISGRIVAVASTCETFDLHIEWLPTTSREAVETLLNYAQDPVAVTEVK